MCSSMHEVLNSVPRTMKERERRESRRSFTDGHFGHLPSFPSPLRACWFPNLSILWFFFFEKKKEGFSYATSVKRAFALFYIKTPFKNPHEVHKMAQLVTADPRLSWWKENQFYPVDL